MIDNLQKPPTGTIRGWVDERASKTPDRVSHIFADDGSNLTWRQLQQGAIEVAEHLVGLGVEKGQSVALCLPNCQHAVLALFGVLYGGFRVLPLNLVAGPGAIGYAVDHSGARVALVGDGQAGLFAEAVSDMDLSPTVVSVSDTIHWPGGSVRGRFSDVKENDHALLMYTSGTTGKPKGVVHTQSSLLAGGWTTTVAHGLTENDRALCVLPYFHINGLCVTLMAPLISGGSVIVADRFSNSQFWAQCETNKATWFSVVPTIISHLLHAETIPPASVVDRLRFARSASAALAPQVQTAFEEKFGIPIVETMGLTETAAQILSNPMPPGTRKTGSPGKAYGNEVQIQQSGIESPRNERGEIAVRGPNVMLEYLNNPEVTAETITPDKWLLTGDLGYMDDDGYVFVTGRSKELIIKGGENIAPREVDDALYQHADVIEAAAFARDCDRYGQRVEAAVVVREGSSVGESDILAICHSRLGKFKSPDTVHFMSDLPKGPSGKIQRRKLTEMIN